MTTESTEKHFLWFYNSVFFRGFRGHLLFAGMTMTEMQKGERP
jgi:hypothetical protein